MAHQRLGAAARREAHLDAARRVRRGEERLRPRRVVAVDEDRLGAVDRERLGVGDEAADRELEVPPLLDRALGHHARAARSASRRGARSRSAARSARRRPSSRPRRIRARAASAASAASSAGLSFRFVTCAWLRGRAPRAQLLQREHQLDRVEQPDDAGELARASARAPAGRARRGARRRRRACARARSSGSAVASAATSRSSPCAARKRSITSNSAAPRPSIRDDAPSSTTSSGSGSFGPVHRDEPELGPAARRAARGGAPTARARGEPPAPRRVSHRRAARAPRRRPPPRGRTSPCAAPELARAARPTPRAPRRSSGRGRSAV